ncbi:MAG: hypothetical protein WBD37_02140, partial [Anderseniella sp.]
MQYLEGLGVKVWPTSDIHKTDEGLIEAVLLVNNSQWNYAAGLVAGAPGFLVLDPHEVKAIAPSTR